MSALHLHSSCGGTRLRVRVRRLHVECRSGACPRERGRQVIRAIVIAPSSTPRHCACSLARRSHIWQIWIFPINPSRSVWLSHCSLCSLRRAASRRAAPRQSTRARSWRPRPQSELALLSCSLIAILLSSAILSRELQTSIAYKYICIA